MSKDNKKIICEEIRAMKFHMPIKKELEEQYYTYLEHIFECKDCGNWDLSRRIIERGGNPQEYCCPTLGDALTDKCEHHPDPWDCPDYVIVKVEEGEYGIPIRDGGYSYKKIDYCPWCGTKIDKSI